MVKSIVLIPRINKANGQINFSIKKNCFPKEIKNKLNDLKSIKLNVGDFEW